MPESERVHKLVLNGSGAQTSSRVETEVLRSSEVASDAGVTSAAVDDLDPVFVRAESRTNCQTFSTGVDLYHKQ